MNQTLKPDLSWAKAPSVLRGPRGLLQFQLLSWQRLEPHSRSSDISKGVQATIHDPAWLLSRQLVLGEFEGEDAASVVYVRMSENHDQIHKIIIGGENLDYDPEIPLEVLIEKTNLEVATSDSSGKRDKKLDLQMRVKLGLQFFKEMKTRLQGVLNSDEIVALKNYLAGQDGYLFQLNDHQARFELSITHDFCSMIQKRVIDIYQAFNSENLGPELLGKLETYYSSRDPEFINNVVTALLEAYKNLLDWWNGSNSETPFFEKPTSDHSAWDPSKLEYKFKVQVGPDNNKLICVAERYKEDHLSWHSFTIESHSDNFLLPESSDNPRIVIPRHLRVPGQPVKRYWNFEDSYVNFGAITPKITNIATLLLLEFSFVHSADWYVIPLTMQMGTLSQIQELKVVDTFGDEIEINPAGQTSQEQELLDEDAAWDSWNPFTLSKKYQYGTRLNSNYLFLPPVISDLTIGPHHEEIKFLRDEVANLAWAIEKTYRTLYGEAISGYEHYHYRKNQLIQNEAEIQAGSKNALKFTFMTDVPWNWIPFIPVHGAKFSSADYPDHRQIVYQRGAMINRYTDTPEPIRPNSRLLNEVPSPYFVDESIIPRTGLILSERFQRTVWFNGKDFLWIGQKKMIGTGEGYSGLIFDKVSLP